RDYTITGVVHDPPHSTHFKYELLDSLISYPNSANNPIWVQNNFYTYLTLDKNTSVEQVENEFPGMVMKYAGPQIQQFMGVSFEKLMEQGASYGFYLQPLRDIHLNSQLELELEPGGNMAYLKIFAVIAIFILLIACINFMNLATARSARRAREVGIRKTLGSTRGMLMGQFLTEAIVISLISFIAALVLVQLLLPFYNNLLGVQLQLDLFSNPNILLSIAALVFLVGMISGSYPAFYLASFDPVKVLKASTQSSSSRSWLRGGLVIFQFAISISLFTGSIVVNNQLDYIQNRELGYNKNHLVIVEKTDDIGQDIEAFKQELKNDSRIVSVTNSNNLFGHNFGQNVVQIQGEPAEKTILLSMVQTDHYFAETYGLELVKGRFYSWDRPGDSTKIVINEAAAKHLGYENPIGHAFDFGNPDNPVYFEIIGVVKDFHFESLHKTIRPFMFSLFGPGGFGRYTAVRISDEDISATLTFIENVWKKYARDQAFEYVFFEDDFNLQYKLENNTKKISTIFSILAIMIASLGLFGLASFSAEQRTKEIGIRKILGASVKNIYVLLSKDLLKLILIATVISWPLSTLVLTRWLEDFAYRINYSHLNFLLAGIMAFTIALITITNQALKSAYANPVKALKYE
ncbi:MAG: FtsX-like permease family protein, partial [Candidatus Neomarinimicrobiota bacterium]